LIGAGRRFPACAKPLHRRVVLIDASAGEGRSEKDMRQYKNREHIAIHFNRDVL